MGLRNDGAGYGLVTKSLHWLTVAALLAQLVVGYVMAGAEDSGGHGRHGGDDDRFATPLLPVHVGLGVCILALAVARVVWRRTTPLPAWAETLTAGERRWEATTEKALLALLFLIPISGLALVLSGDDDLLWLHVVTHVAFFVALAAHVGLVLKHQLLLRDGLLRRMTY